MKNNEYLNWSKIILNKGEVLPNTKLTQVQERVTYLEQITNIKEKMPALEKLYQTLVYTNKYEGIVFKFNSLLSYAMTIHYNEKKKGGD